MHLALFTCTYIQVTRVTCSVTFILYYKIWCNNLSKVTRYYILVSSAQIWLLFSKMWGCLPARQLFCWHQAQFRLVFLPRYCIYTIFVNWGPGTLILNSWPAIFHFQVFTTTFWTNIILGDRQGGRNENQEVVDAGARQGPRDMAREDNTQGISANEARSFTC